MRRYIAFITILILGPLLSTAGANSPSYKLSGDVSLLSHYVDNGLSQSNKSPSLQASFWFNMGPQFRLGLWGSNTNYENSSDNFNLRLIADILVTFSATSDLRISYSQSQYYNTGDHNGNILGAHLKFYSDYHLLYESFSNWEATKSGASRIALGRRFSVLGNWLWTNELGYNTVSDAGINAYLDARTGLGTSWAQVFFEGSITGTSDASQFNGAGDFFLILSAKTEF